MIRFAAQNDFSALGEGMHRFAGNLYPICRSITGDGVRRTLSMIGERIPLQVFEVPTGTAVFDWTVPKEWSVRDAYVADLAGKRLIDFRANNLHLMSYSAPVDETMAFSELRSHLFTISERPDWIPYRTSYYKEDWGFCLSERQLSAFDERDNYKVVVDSALSDGSLTYGDCYLPGRTSDEVLISCHVCHPSLANDNLSGITVAAALAQELARHDLHYSYRILFIPGTIGAITWLAKNKETASRIRHGLVLTCLGDGGSFHYKKSRRGDADIDRAAGLALKAESESAAMLEFSPYGYDERQYCSPGFNLPVGCLMRSVWGTFPEYHTSADNLDFVQPKSLGESLRVVLSILEIVENNRIYRNLNPYCEPQLGRRGLYSTTGGRSIGDEINARLWVLNQSDGKHSLLDIAERSGMAFAAIVEAADVLREAGLLACIAGRNDGNSHGSHEDEALRALEASRF